ncbi:MAG: hypothetical protein ISR64_03385 [Deltaproteobacteria bacterium]|nr:hypothetical protein [Deltaproteobacteria bacterium]
MRGSAVSVGLVRSGVPVLGVVYAPTYPDDRGDLIAWAEGLPLTRNGKDVKRATLPERTVSSHVHVPARAVHAIQERPRARREHQCTGAARPVHLRLHRELRGVPGRPGALLPCLSQGLLTGISPRPTVRSSATPAVRRCRVRPFFAGRSAGWKRGPPG